VLFLTLPGIYGTASHKINVMVSRFLALDFNESGATFIYLANRLVELPLGVFTIAISTVIFPSMAQTIAKGKGVEFGKTYRKGISLSMMLTLPAAVGLSMLAPEIVTVLFERGEFSVENASSLSPILIICAIGMPFYDFVSIETRAFYSNKDTKTPVKGSTLALIVNIILSISLLGLLGRIEALVIASNAAIVVQAAYMHLRLCRLDLSLRLAEVMPSMLKYLVGCIVLAVVLCSLELALDDVRPSIRLAVSVPVGGAAYFIALRILKVREINAARHLFGSKGRSY
jgi:putative peptidoglycan lipid II flippase